MQEPEHKALSGFYVLVTRPQHQAKNLCSLIENAGGHAIKFPTIEIRPCTRPALAIKVLQNLGDFHWVIFVSANAVKYALSMYNSSLHFPPSIRVAAIGKATAAALFQAEIKVDLRPKEQFNSEALLATSEMQSIKGKACVIVRGQGGRELLGETLRNRGAAVVYAEVYRRDKPQMDVAPLLTLWQQKGIDVVTVTSGEALQNLLEMLGEQGTEVLKLIPLVVVSNRLKKLALTLGFTRVEIAAQADDLALFRTIQQIRH